MSCKRALLHTVAQGDTLWALSRRYDTTVEEILRQNPGTDVYNLQIGACLLICVGDGYQPDGPAAMPVPPIGMVPPTGMMPEVPPVACSLPKNWCNDTFVSETMDRFFDFTIWLRNQLAGGIQLDMEVLNEIARAFRDILVIVERHYGPQERQQMENQLRFWF